MTKHTYETESSNNLWLESAGRCKFGIHNGQVVIGVSGENAGFIVPLTAPAWFAAIPHDGMRDNVFRALTSHALRVGQGKVKAAKEETAADATAGANSVLDGSYKPSREVVSDIIQGETDRRFGDLVRGLVMAAKPTASDKEVDATIAKQAATEKGKAKLAELREAVVSEMAYSVSKKGGKGSALEISL